MRPEIPSAIDSIESRKTLLLPNRILKEINRQYAKSWAPEAERSIESGESFESREGAMWIAKHGEEKKVMDMLPQRIEAVVRQGRPFRIMDVGSGSYAKLFTGFGPKEFISVPDNIYLQGRGVEKQGAGLAEILQSWGFEAGKHFELVSVHGGEFVIPEKEGLRLITTNIFDRIPVEPQSVDLLLSFRTVYQSFGGFYLLEYFDRLLSRSTNSEEAGMAVVWPFEDGGNRIVVMDENHRALSFETIFQNLQREVSYWDRGRHVAWIKNDSGDLRFPLKPFALYFQPNYMRRMTMAYQLEANFRKANKAAKKITYHEDPNIIKELRRASKEIFYF